MLLIGLFCGIGLVWVGWGGVRAGLVGTSCGIDQSGSIA